MKFKRIFDLDLSKQLKEMVQALKFFFGKEDCGFYLSVPEVVIVLGRKKLRKKRFVNHCLTLDLSGKERIELLDFVIRCLVDVAEECVN